MTERDVIEESKDRPDEWILWLGDKTDYMPDRDEAMFRLGHYLASGGDAYGHPGTAGGVYHGGKQVAAGQNVRGAVRFLRQP